MSLHKLDSQYTLSQLTEQEIIRAALPFIRSYYKFRPRGEAIMETRYDVATVGGVIADGYLAFETEEGEPFIVTVESTSQKTRDEVIYAIQNKILNWDSLACTSLLLAGIYAYYHHKGYNIAQLLGEIPTVLIISGGFCLGLFLFRFLLGWMRRYRYIYAIEQFKQYDATEQWIALGENVFVSNVDKDFVELKEQCVDNGFGLVMVDEQLDVQMLITPARDAVNENRKGVVFEDQGIVVKATRSKQVKKWLGDKTSRLSKARPTVGLGRYRAGFYKQLLTMLIGLSVITGIFYKEWKDSPIAYVDEDQYQRDQLVKSKDIRKEKKGYFMEEELHLNWDSITGNYLSLEESIWENDVPATSTIVYSEDDLLELEANPKSSNNAPTEIVVATKDGLATSYDCERFYNFKGALYLVQDGIYSGLSIAQRRLNLLSTGGFNASILWLGCFGESEEYVVYYELMFPKRSEAMSEAKAIIRDLKRKKIPYGTLKIRTLRKSTN